MFMSVFVPFAAGRRASTWLLKWALLIIPACGRIVCTDYSFAASWIWIYIFVYMLRVLWAGLWVGRVSTEQRHIHSQLVSWFVCHFRPVVSVCVYILHVCDAIADDKTPANRSTRSLYATSSATASLCFIIPFHLFEEMPSGRRCWRVGCKWI